MDGIEGMMKERECKRPKKSKSVATRSISVGEGITSFSGIAQVKRDNPSSPSVQAGQTIGNHGSYNSVIAQL